MTALATSAQVRAIQTARRRQGLDEPAYRDALRSFGVTSCKDLTTGQAGAFLDGLTGGRGGVERPSSRRAGGRYAPILKALWLSAWNLGVVRDHDDAALLAFAKRQAKVDHTRFLRDPKDAALVIQAVKAMLVRGGVRWPKKTGPGAIEVKRAVVAAIYARLGAHGLYPECRPFADLDGAALDALANRLGRVLRPALQASTKGETS